MMGGEDEIISIWERILEKSCYCMYTFTNLGR